MNKDNHILVGGESQGWGRGRIMRYLREIELLTKQQKNLDTDIGSLLKKRHLIPMDKMFIGMAKIILHQMLMVIMFPMVGKFFDRRGNRLGTYDKDLNRIKD